MKESKIEIPGQVIHNAFFRHPHHRTIQDWINSFVSDDDIQFSWNWMMDRDIVELRMWGDELPVTAATTFWMSQIMDYVNQGSKIRFSVAMEDEQLP